MYQSTRRTAHPPARISLRTIALPYGLLITVLLQRPLLVPEFYTQGPVRHINYVKRCERALFARMAMSVAELDQTVQTFYEGRGEVVWFTLVFVSESILTLQQQKQAQNTLNQVRPTFSRVGRLCLNTLSPTVQRKSGCMALSGQDPSRRILPANQMLASSDDSLF